MSVTIENITPGGKATGLYLDPDKPENSARIEKINKAWAAYNGLMPDPIPVKTNRPNDNIKTNHVKTVVDVGVSTLFGETLEIVLDDTTDTETQEEAWINAVMAFNKADILFQRLAINGAISGHAFIKLIPFDGFLPRLVALDPRNVTVTTCADDLQEVQKYTIEWAGIHNTEKAVYRQIIERSDLVPSAPANDVFMKQIIRTTPLPVQTDTDGIHHWRIVDQVRTTKTIEYKDGDRDLRWETLAVDIWEWEFPPIIDCQNLPAANHFWGESDIEPDVIALQHGINRALTNMNKILRLHAHPKTWASGLSEEQLRQLAINPEGIIGLPNPESSLHNLEMTSDLMSSLSYYDRVREAFHERTAIPEIATGKMSDIGQLSGLALSILYTPLIQKTMRKRLTYGYLVEEVCARLLYIFYGPQKPPTEIDYEYVSNGKLWNVSIVWPEVIPTDPKAEAETLMLHSQLGVSKRTLLMKAGYDPDEEERNNTEAQVTAMEAMQEMSAGVEKGRTPGLDPFGRDLNASNGGTDNNVED